jgi:hypothetical protein
MILKLSGLLHNAVPAAHTMEIGFKYEFANGKEYGYCRSTQSRLPKISRSPDL